MKRANNIIVTSAWILSFPLLSARADVIGSVADVPAANTVYDLTALGAVDWAFYDTTANPANGLPTNSKNGGTAIGTASAVGGGNIRGSASSLTEPDFTYTDGTSPASGTGENPGGLFNTQLDTLGAGLQLSIDLPTTDTYKIYIWTAAFNAQATFTAALTGFTSYTDSSMNDSVGPSPKPSYLYTLTAKPNTAGDDLVVSLASAADNGTSSHVVLEAVAISVVPEPATLGLLIAGLGLVGFRRRLC